MVESKRRGGRVVNFMLGNVENAAEKKRSKTLMRCKDLNQR